jgi:hypothetical protein
MKKLLLVLLLVSGAVHAKEEWLESDNEGGGKIVLLPNECPNVPKLKRMYAYTKSGETIWGCWNFWTGMIHVVYDKTGSSYTYNPELFVVKSNP